MESKILLKEKFDEWIKIANSITNSKSEKLFWEIKRFAEREGLQDYFKELTLEGLKKEMEIQNDIM